MWSGQDEIFLPSSSLKKRKRDTLELEVPPSINNIRIIPSHLHNLDTSFQLSYTGSLEQNDECSPRLKCVTRKRRALQQPGFYTPQLPQSAFPLQFHSDTTQTKALPQSICFPVDPNVSSPPVSPKSLVPRLAQQNSCASASLLHSCHICHRRPTTRELLEAYADCDLCGQRACFICLRRCDAVDCCGPVSQQDQERWSGALDSLQADADKSALQDSHSRRICSCCAVEGVTENGIEVVRCIACIR